jgi:hypothetical protein
MDHAGVWQAWKLWSSGKLTDDFLLYGIRLLWWGRIGKGLELIGGLTIVLDIIGPERLRLLGRSLHTYLPYEVLIKALKAPFLWLQTVVNPMADFLAALLRKSRPDPWSSPRMNYKFNNVVTLLNVFVTLYLTAHLPGWLVVVFRALRILVPGAENDWIVRARVFLVVFYSVGAITTCILVVLVIVMGLLLDLVVMRPAAFALERPHFDKWVKGIATLLLLVGFHFDLLAA